VGRWMVLGVLVHLGEVPGALQLAVAGTVLGQAVTMARFGPATGLRLPVGWAADATVRSFELRTNGGPREDRS
jgi:hypothetical protein